jgi:hypothetical protein
MRMTVHNWDLHPKLTEGGVVGMCGVHGIGNLLTLNFKDFRRFSGIAVVSQEVVLALLS